MIAPQVHITEWKDWAEIVGACLLGSFLIGFFSAAARDALTHWRQSRRRRPRLTPAFVLEQIEKEEALFRARASAPITFPQSEQAAARVAAAKLGFFNLPRLGILTRIRAALAEWLTALARRVAPPPPPEKRVLIEPRLVSREDGVVEHRDEHDEIYGIYCSRAGELQVTDGLGKRVTLKNVRAGSLLPIRTSTPPIFTPAVPPGQMIWPACMGIGIGAAMKHRERQLLGDSRFMRAVATASASGGITTRLEGQRDPDGPWSTIAPLPQGRTTTFAIHVQRPAGPPDPPRPPFPPPVA